MPDFLVRDIDPSVADRIKRVASERGLPINDTILLLINEALDIPHPQPLDISQLTALLAEDESRVLDEAMSAFKDIPKSTPY